jgi:hypothetical protein
MCRESVATDEAAALMQAAATAAGGVGLVPWPAAELLMLIITIQAVYNAGQWRNVKIKVKLNFQGQVDPVNTLNHYYTV